MNTTNALKDLSSKNNLETEIIIALKQNLFFASALSQTRQNLICLSKQMVAHGMQSGWKYKIIALYFSSVSALLF